MNNYNITIICTSVLLLAPTTFAFAEDAANWDYGHWNQADQPAPQIQPQTNDQHAASTQPASGTATEQGSQSTEQSPQSTEQGSQSTEQANVQNEKQNPNQAVEKTTEPATQEQQAKDWLKQMEDQEKLETMPKQFFDSAADVTQ